MANVLLLRILFYQCPRKCTFLDWVGNRCLGTADVGSLCDLGSVVVFSVLFSLSLVQSGPKGKLVRSLAVCEESSPRPGAENLHDNQVHLQSLLLAAWLTSIFSCMIVLLNWAFNSVFLGGKITSNNEHVFFMELLV